MVLGRPSPENRARRADDAFRDRVLEVAERRADRQNRLADRAALESPRETTPGRSPSTLTTAISLISSPEPISVAALSSVGGDDLELPSHPPPRASS